MIMEKDINNQLSLIINMDYLLSYYLVACNYKKCPKTGALTLYFMLTYLILILNINQGIDH